MKTSPDTILPVDVENLLQRLLRKSNTPAPANMEPIANFSPAEADERYYAMLSNQTMAA